MGPQRGCPSTSWQPVPPLWFPALETESSVGVLPRADVLTQVPVPTPSPLCFRPPCAADVGRRRYRRRWGRCGVEWPLPPPPDPGGRAGASRPPLRPAPGAQPTPPGLGRAPRRDHRRSPGLLLTPRFRPPPPRQGAARRRAPRRTCCRGRDRGPGDLPQQHLPWLLACHAPADSVPQLLQDIPP